MPVMDGYETMQHIRSNQKIAQLPILALTANAINSEIQRCMDCGASDYLSKPFFPEDLYLKIMKLLKNSGDTVRSTGIDLDVLASFTNGKESLMMATLTELSNVLTVEKDELWLKIQESDQQSIRARMHKLKPNFQMIGHIELSEMARLAEHEEDSEELIRIAKGIVGELPRILEGIEFELNQLGKMAIV
jgi:DNA-binding response OmpR family regulator